MSAGVGSKWLLEQVSDPATHPCCLVATPTHQAKKVVVFLGRAKPAYMVRELIKELEVSYDIMRGVAYGGVQLLERRASVR